MGWVGVGRCAAAPPADKTDGGFGGWAETNAAYRLLDNPALEWRDRLEVHTRRTGERLQGPPLVLGLQDTTEADFTRQPGLAGLGRRSDEAHQGLDGHPPRVVTPDGVALGVIDAWRGAREPKEVPPVKESPRWREGDERVAEGAAQVPQTRLVSVADREGDMRDWMALAAQRGPPRGLAGPCDP